MSKLSPKERALIDAARKGWRPSASVTRAVRAGIPERLREEPTLGVEAPGPADLTPSIGRFAAAKAFVRSPWGAVTGLAVVGLCAAFGARGVLEDRRSSPGEAATTAISAPSAPALPAPAPETRALPEIGTVSLDSLPDALPDVGPKKAGAAFGARPPAKHPTSQVAPTADTLAEEVALVRAAQRSLRDGSPKEALASLATHASRFPNGVLREERMTLQALSFCALGDLPKARGVRAELERLSPSSSHLQRLSCAAEPE
jgi:hypothetical protein